MRVGANRQLPVFVPLSNWRVILVSPQTAENVGAVARIMNNFGCRELFVINPRCKIDPQGEAGKMACWSQDILEGHNEVDTLDEALSGCHFSVALTMLQSDDRPADFMGYIPTAILDGLSTQEQCALVFGREDHGLTNEECAKCTRRWVIPSNPEAPSLNLAQAVAVALAGIAEAGRLSAGTAVQSSFDDEESIATQDEVEGLLGHVEEVLNAANYERGVPLEYPMRLTRRAALRARLRQNEVRVLRGMCRRILNAILGYERR